MKLYIGNGSRHVVDFNFRRLVERSIQRREIPPGGQIEVSETHTKEEIDHVLKQHLPYGLIPVDEIDRHRGPYSGLCYSIDKPINVSSLRRAMERKQESLEEQGVRLRQEAGVATHNQIESQMQDTGSPARLKELEMTVVEQEPRGGYSSDHKPVGEGLKISRDRPSSPVAKKASRRR